MKKKKKKSDSDEDVTDDSPLLPPRKIVGRVRKPVSYAVKSDDDSDWTLSYSRLAENECDWLKHSLKRKLKQGGWDRYEETSFITQF